MVSDDIKLMADTNVRLISAAKPSALPDDLHPDALMAMMRTLDTLQTDVDISHPEKKYWFDETYNITPTPWCYHLDIADMKKRALASSIEDNVVRLRIEPPKQGRVIDFSHPSVNVDQNDKQIVPPIVMTYQVFTGDVYLCDIECEEYAVTGHMHGNAQYAMHASMMKAFNEMSAEQLRHHVKKNNPYAIHVQSAREHDGNLIDAILPPRHDTIRFVMMGAAR